MKTIQEDMLDSLVGKICVNDEKELFFLKRIKDGVVIFQSVNQETKQAEEGRIEFGAFLMEPDMVVDYDEACEINPEDFYILAPPDEIVKLRKEGRFS